MRETLAIYVKAEILKRMKKYIILHAKIFPAKILLHKKLFDFSQIFRKERQHFEIKFLEFLLESDNFLLNIIFSQTETFRLIM